METVARVRNGIVLNIEVTSNFETGGSDLLVPCDPNSDNPPHIGLGYSKTHGFEQPPAPPAPQIADNADARQLICEGCDSYQSEHKTCTECGCYTLAITAIADYVCPLGKW